MLIASAINIRTDLINAGANWMEVAVVIDGLLVSSRSGDDLEYFNAAAYSILDN